MSGILISSTLLKHLAQKKNRLQKGENIDLISYILYNKCIIYLAKFERAYGFDQRFLSALD